MTGSKIKPKSLTEEYLEYHECYVKKFGKERTLVLMQVGTFYEAYATNERGPDLKILEDLTEATIAHKGKDKSKINMENPLMWGFPMIASLKFIGILIDSGYRLIMIDQTSPKPNIRREVVAIHSPATYLESAYKPTSNFVANICIEEIQQKNGKILACVGMSAIDVSTGETYIHESYSHMNDDKLGLDETLRFLNSLVPKEIIIHKENLIKLKEDYMIEYLDLEGKFYQFRDINKEHIKITYQKRLLEKVYPERQNMTSIIDTLGMSKTLYARKSFVNLLTYVADHYEDLIKGVAEPIFFLHESNLVLGNDAINQLNIVDNTGVSDVPGSVKYRNLLDVINKGNTGMGKRYIKMRLTSPYTDTTILNNIYDIVEILLKDNFYIGLDKTLKQINDIERLYRKLTLGTLHPMHIVDLINSYKSILLLFENISKNVPLSKKIKTLDLRKSIKKLNNKFDSKINIEKARMFTMTDIKENIFQDGIYPDLDKIQVQISSNHSVMNELLDKLNWMIINNYTNNHNYNSNFNQHSNSIIIKHNTRDGYYYQLTPKRYKHLAESLKNVDEIILSKQTIDVEDFEISHFNNNVKISLPFLKNQTTNIDELIEKVANLTYNYYMDFLNDINKEFGETLRETISLITKIDYYTTIAKVSKEYNYVKPIIKEKEKEKKKIEKENIKKGIENDDSDEEVDADEQVDEEDKKNNIDNNMESFISAKDIRHPIVERIIDHEYIPHSIDIGREMKGMLIYGLNSAGKSVLMKAIGLSIIMAQAGFFVPAREFIYYPYKALYTRITGNDNLFRGLSSYSLEIVELNSILKRSNKSTLVIGDEVCRGTEHISGNSIVAATLLKLSDIGSTFVFATHLHELMEIDELKDKNNIKAFHLSVEHDEKMDRLIYDRELKPGSGERIYGITVAKYIIRDNAFIAKALEIKNKLLNRDPTSSTISSKKSRYNSQLLMDSCYMCGKKNTDKGTASILETHHINHQKDCEDGFVKNKPHIKKNQIFNLMVLCQTCHDKIHNENIEIDGVHMTSNGKKVIVKKKKNE